ncbi:MAG: homoserine dehydrogenase [Candidatus Dormibacter sp.]
MRDVRLALLGFGHVGQAFARLLLLKAWLLRERQGLNPLLTAVITGRHGWAVDERGLQLSALLSGPGLANRGAPPAIGTLPADVLIELTPVSPRDGEPALGYLRDGLAAGMDVITANKGAIAHGFHALSALAEQHGRRLRFEATVADDLPVFNLMRSALPTAKVGLVRGILNSTTNYLLSQAARGVPWDEALAEAQRRGIAERDPSHDLDGWDAALKATIIANVVMGIELTVSDVVRQPVTAETGERARAAAAKGLRLRALAAIGPFGTRWAPVELGPEDPFFAVDGFSMAIELDTDVAGRLALALHDPGVEQTAFAILADLIDVAGTPH